MVVLARASQLLIEVVAERLAERSCPSRTEVRLQLVEQSDPRKYWRAGAAENCPLRRASVNTNWAALILAEQAREHPLVIETSASSGTGAIAVGPLRSPGRPAVSTVPLVGNWGPGLFDDDQALDMKNEWISRVDAGEPTGNLSIELEARAATVVMRAGLVAGFLETGFHNEDLLRRLDVELRGPEVLAGWSDPVLLHEREASILRFREQIDQALSGVEPGSRASIGLGVRRLGHTDTPLRPGVVYSYPWRGEKALIWVVGIDTQGSIAEPVVQLLDWIGSDTSAVSLRKLRPLKNPDAPRIPGSLADKIRFRDYTTSFLLVATDPADDPTAALVEVGVRRIRRILPPTATHAVVAWSKLPELLARCFGASK